MSAPKIYFGAGLFSKDQGYNSVEEIKPWLAVLSESKSIISSIDTAVTYRECEEWLGQLKVDAQFGFPIDTKLTGGPHPALVATKDNIIAQARESLSKTGAKQFGTLYLHAPDPRVPVEETLSGFDALYEDGVFKHFGLTYHTSEQVEEVIKHKISFVAYSPMAGGFLAKTSQQFRHQPESFHGRWDRAGFLGNVYHFLYNKPPALEALDKWNEIAAAEGISGEEMAYRWVAYNSALTTDDDMVIGATTIEQWKSNLAAIQKGPLSPETAARIDALWTPELKKDGILDNFVAIKGAMVSPM
ncbi:hypothetical protein JX265_001789 [Neoarthrinium moseri]|uniref:NADP-dependent oxidoreductase domain-containing protein n=1 Tax=Neoarthrinium moseri TaxID=1658444 RepID=A0A9P9WW45_9PEZI|nr:hypothetical protein JX265_001789 [Neoarthrinium moseri]